METLLADALALSADIDDPVTQVRLEGVVDSSVFGGTKGQLPVLPSKPHYLMVSLQSN